MAEQVEARTPTGLKVKGVIIGAAAKPGCSLLRTKRGAIYVVRLP